jgi:hypothetical protein
MTETQETSSLQGWNAPLTSDAERRAAVDAAFDYRGDVTLTLNDGRTLTGFVSNRDFAAAEPFLELFAADQSAHESIPLRRLAAIRFTGVDPAAGKSWDLWLKKVAQAEAEGKIAELYPDEH